ncbi:hypothetical protein [Actinoplanes sp. NPDC020271]|uniref:hypothetical protein n=1 Tax=Actinoplanes sp. NPDC020271 TaxID=3363896 RepID=UPI0037BC758B
MLTSLLLVLAITGCHKAEEPGVATANPSATAAGAATAENRDPLAYSRCMRDQGLTWFPDPDPQGGLTVHNPDGVDQKKVEAAEQACRKYAPWEGKSDPMPADDLAKLRDVAQCMRDHGLTNWPDPDADGSTAIDAKKLGIEPGDPKVTAAQKECHKLAPTPKGKPAG